MTAKDQNAYRAGWTRVVLGVFGLAAIPILPGLSQHRTVIVLYLAAALTCQLLITKRIGGELRALVMGLIDLGVLTFFVHRLGSNMSCG